MAYLDQEEIILIDGEVYDPLEVSVFSFKRLEAIDGEERDKTRLDSFEGSVDS